MKEKQPVSGLAALPPGPELAALLAGVGLPSVANADTVALLQAWSRQLAHTQAGFLAALVEVTRSTPFTRIPAGERPSVAESNRRLLAAGDWAAAEIAAALAWTSRGAEKEVDFAVDLLEKVPLVFTALSSGGIDRMKAWTFVDVLATATVTATQLEQICKALLPRAGSWTTGQLRWRLLRMIVAIDPGYAARRYRAAVEDRGVVGYLGPDGTAVVRGFGLSPAEAAAACERLDGLAEQIVRAGHPGAVHQVRADLFTGLLDGRFEGLGSAEIIAVMLAEGAEAPATTGSASPDAGSPNADVPDAGGHSADAVNAGSQSAGRQSAGRQSADVPKARSQGTDGPSADVPGNGPPHATQPTDDRRDQGPAHLPDTSRSADVAAADVAAADEASADVVAPDKSDPATVLGPQDIDEAASDEAAPDEATSDEAASDDAADDVVAAIGRGGGTADRWGGEIRLGLATLLLRDDRPGEIPGWGPVLADVARLMAARQIGSEWRFAVTDPDGFLILAGITRRRPHPTNPSGRACRGGVVELHIPATLLAELATDADACGEWAAVIADIARQYARRDRLTAALAARPDDRLAHAALRRHVQIRDRRCVAPGCRRPARRCELDHTFDYARGGLTLAENSGPLCLRHHLMKTEGGWQLEQPQPGRFHWTSPLGRSYWTRGEPIDPPDPDPHPRPVDPDEPDDRPATCWMDGPTMQRPPPRPDPPPSRLTTPPEDHPPPF